jgi:hypothetical protein
VSGSESKRESEMSESESWSETKIETETNHLLDIKATNHS